MAAARAMARGDWQKAYNFITALKLWSLMPQRDAVQAMLLMKLKQESLRIYLFTYGSQYQALSLEQLCRMFQLDRKQVCCLSPHLSPSCCTALLSDRIALAANGIGQNAVLCILWCSTAFA